METLTTPLTSKPFLHHQCPPLLPSAHFRTSRRAAARFSIKALKAPEGVVVPKELPKIAEPAVGFTRVAEVWNSRACMIGLVGTVIVELIFNKGILQMIGVEVGKGLDLPL